MFEDARYLINASTLIIFIYYIICINIGFALLGSIGWIVHKMLKLRVTLTGKIFIGYTFYTAVTWWVYKASYPMSAGLFICLVAVFVIGLYGFVTLKKVVQLGRCELLHLAVHYLPLFILQSIIVFFWSGYLSDHNHHILVGKNNDIFFWGMVADHIYGISDLNRITFGENFVSQINDCFGVYSWLGLLTKISYRQHSVEAVQLFELSLIIVISWVVYGISSRILAARRTASIIIALAFSFNPLILVVFTNNFLSQLTQTFCFLAAILIIGELKNIRASMGKMINGGIVALSFLFSYPGISPLYFIFIVVAVCLLTIMQEKVKDKIMDIKSFKGCAVFVTGMLLGVVLFSDFAYHAVSRFMALAGADAGWPLSMLDIRNLIGFPSSALDNTIFSTWTAYLLLTLILCVVLTLHLRNKSQHSYQVALNWLLLLSLIALAAYEYVYFLKGDSYQQWKFATYFVVPLLLIAIANMIAPKKIARRVLFPDQVFYLVFCVLLGYQLYLSAKLDDLHLATEKSLKELAELDKMPFRKLVLDISPSRETMLAMNMLGQHELSSIAESYLKPAELKSEEISTTNPMLINIKSRFVDDKSTFSEAGKVFQMLTEVHPFIQVTVIGESYQQETSGNSSWYWIRKNIKFGVNAFTFGKKVNKILVRFKYITRGNQALTIRLKQKDSQDLLFLVQGHGDKYQKFERFLDISPDQITSIEISSDGNPTLLSNHDTRLAAWMLRNFDLKIVHDEQEVKPDTGL